MGVDEGLDEDLYDGGGWDTDGNWVTPPVDGEPYVAEPAVVAGLVVQSSSCSDEDVVAVLREGVEGVVGQCMGVELTWTTSAIVGSDDLSSEYSDTGRSGIDWDFALGRGEPLRSVAVGATTTAMQGYHWHPKWAPVRVGARMPISVAHGRGDAGGLVVKVQMHRWAMYGGGENLVRVAGFVEPWLLGAAERLGADTGYVSLDRQNADGSESGWELATMCSPGLRDTTRTLWGYGWGTLLSPVHVAAIGGLGVLDVVREVAPGLEVRPVAGGRTWVRLGADPGGVTAEQVRALREVLLPALPIGYRTIEEYERAVARGEEPARYIL